MDFLPSKPPLFFLVGDVPPAAAVVVPTEKDDTNDDAPLAIPYLPLPLPKNMDDVADSGGGVVLPPPLLPLRLCLLFPPVAAVWYEHVDSRGDDSDRSADSREADRRSFLTSLRAPPSPQLPLPLRPPPPPPPPKSNRCPASRLVPRPGEGCCGICSGGGGGGMAVDLPPAAAAALAAAREEANPECGWGW